MRGEGPYFLTIAEAAKLTAAKKLSPVELTRSVLMRAAAAESNLHAFLTLTHEHAAAAARAAERRRRPTAKASRLRGVPLAYQDNLDTAGVPTTANSRLLADNVPKQDAEAVRRLGEAGAVMLGKLALHEFGVGGPSLDLPWPPARNPWDVRRSVGGASSGAAVAVAAGLCLGAIAADTAGSMRLSAAHCGVAALMPTRGLVSRRGLIPVAPSLDVVGPMAWTAEDCAILLDAMAGHDPADPASAPGGRPSHLRALPASIRGLRVGLLRQAYERDLPAAPEIVRATAQAADVLRRLGCKVEDAVLPPIEDYHAVCRVILSAEAYALHEPTLRSRLADYSRSFRVGVLGGGLIRAADYITAQRRRTDLIAATASALQRFDVLVAAASAEPAPLPSDQKAGSPASGLGVVASVAGAPSLVVRAGRTTAGLPIGIEIMGRPWEDGTVLRVGHHFEQATEWGEARPEL